MVVIQRSIKEEVPPGAILLTEREALQMQRENLDRLDVAVTWPIDYGRKIFAVPVGLQCVFLLDRFRRKYRLGNYGLLSSMLPFAMAPVLINGYFQEHRVIDKVLLQNECPVCLLTDSVLISTFTGNIIGGFGGAVATLWYAHNKGTYVLPARKWENLLVFGKQLLDLNRRNMNIHWAMLAINIFVSTATLALQDRALRQIQDILEDQDLQIAKQIHLREKQKRYNV